LKTTGEFSSNAARVIPHKRVKVLGIACCVMAPRFHTRATDEQRLLATITIIPFLAWIAE